MKVAIEELKEEKFKPFGLNIAIESEGELNLLWHLFNRSVSEIKKYSDKDLNRKINLSDGKIDEIIVKLWDAVDKK